MSLDESVVRDMDERLQIGSRSWADVTVLGWGSASCASAAHVINEDAVLAGPTVFAVADGMGGHAGGALASESAVNILSAVGPPPVSPEEVVSAIQRANREIHEFGEQDPQIAGLGTTLSGIALVREQNRDVWMVFNCGDSRVYRIADGVLCRLTHDHSEIQERLDAGEIDVEQATRDTRRHVLTRALGPNPNPEIDYEFLVPRAGDRFVVCSDGVTTVVADHEIERLLKLVSRPDEAARRLVAVAAGGAARDDICAVIVDTIRVQDDPLSADTVVPRGRWKVGRQWNAQ